MTVENNTTLTYQEKRPLWKRGFHEVSIYTSPCFLSVYYAMITSRALKYGVLKSLKRVIKKASLCRSAASSIVFITAAVTANTVDDVYKNKLTNPYRNKQIQEIIKNSSENEKSALIIKCTPESDPKGAFEPSKVFHHYKSLSKNHSITSVTGSSEIYREMGSEKKYDLIILKGHGSQEGLTLNHGQYEEYARITMDDQEKFKQLHDHVKVNGKIVVDSCDTGKGDDNFAQRLSKSCPTATIYAAKGRIQENYNFLDEDGNPQLGSWKNRNLTRIYQEGRLIVDPVVVDRPYLDLIERICHLID